MEIALSDIESYRPIRLDEVYDITVQDEHCYFLDCQKYILVHNSGKTYGIQDWLIGLAYRSKYSISTCSVSLPHLKKGAMRDWRELMENKGSYNPQKHNMTDQVYKYPLGSYMEFFSVDDAKRVRGPGRDILHVNEANLISLDTWRQLILRTKLCIILDYNPADELHWIYDEVLPRKDCKFIQTTYKDNPYISKAQREEIERLKDIDADFWNVYGLGERGTHRDTIYSGFELYDTQPDLDYHFGLDFGFTHPNALVKVIEDEDKLYFEQALYEPGLTAVELAQRVKPIVGTKYVYCDSSRPEVIEELQRSGVNAMPADKAVKEGIDFVRSHRIFVHRESVPFQKEMRSYKWKRKPNGQTLDEPVKAFDDLMDAGRYGAMGFKSSFVGVHLSGF